MLEPDRQKETLAVIVGCALVRFVRRVVVKRFAKVEVDMILPSTSTGRLRI